MSTAVPGRVAVQQADEVSAARALAARAARAAGLTASAVQSVDLVVTELSENLRRHAHGGELLVLPPGDAGSPLLRIIAVDRGPGHANFDACIVDGYSSAGTLGTGLGAVRRRSDRFDAVSEPDRGTIVRAGFAVPGAETRDDSHFDVGAVGLPIGDESVNGDACAAAQHGSRLALVLADGLGHGPRAAEASSAVLAVFRDVANLSPGSAVLEINRRVASSRGAAVTAASIELDAAGTNGEVVSAGLGNVSVLVVAPDGRSKRIVTTLGTAGARPLRRVDERRIPFPPRGSVVLHSDGLSSSWTLDGRSELLRAHPDLVAAALWRDYARNSDDTMVLVARTRVSAPV